MAQEDEEVTIPQLPPDTADGADYFLGAKASGQVFRGSVQDIIDGVQEQVEGSGVVLDLVNQAAAYAEQAAANGAVAKTATPSSSPAAGVDIVSVSQSGVYTNFGGVEVFPSDFSSGFVQLRKEDGVWRKVKSDIDLISYVSKAALHRFNWVQNPSETFTANELQVLDAIKSFRILNGDATKNYFISILADGTGTVPYRIRLANVSDSTTVVTFDPVIGDVISGGVNFFRFTIPSAGSAEIVIDYSVFSATGNIINTTTQKRLTLDKSVFVGFDYNRLINKPDFATYQDKAGIVDIREISLPLNEEPVNWLFNPNEAFNTNEKLIIKAIKKIEIVNSPDPSKLYYVSVLGNADTTFGYRIRIRDFANPTSDLATFDNMSVPNPTGVNRLKLTAIGGGAVYVTIDYSVFGATTGLIINTTATKRLSIARKSFSTNDYSDASNKLDAYTKTELADLRLNLFQAGKEPSLWVSDPSAAFTTPERSALRAVKFIQIVNGDTSKRYFLSVLAKDDSVVGYRIRFRDVADPTLVVGGFDGTTVTNPGGLNVFKINLLTGTMYIGIDYSELSTGTIINTSTITRLTVAKSAFWVFDYNLLINSPAARLKSLQAAGIGDSIMYDANSGFVKMAAAAGMIFNNCATGGAPWNDMFYTKAGTVTSATVNPNIVGVGTVFLSYLSPGHRLYDSSKNLIGTILTVNSDTSLTLEGNSIIDYAGSFFYVPISSSPVHNGENSFASNHVRLLKKRVDDGINVTPKTIYSSYGTNQLAAPDGDFDVIMSYPTYLDIPHSLLATTYGGMRYTIEWLLTLFPNATLVVCTPLQVGEGSGGRTYVALQHRRDVIIKMAQKYSCQVIDCFYESGITGQFEVTNGSGRYLADGVHPKSTGQVLQGNYLLSKVNQMYYSKT